MSTSCSTYTVYYVVNAHGMSFSLMHKLRTWYAHIEGVATLETDLRVRIQDNCLHVSRVYKPITGVTGCSRGFHDLLHVMVDNFTKRYISISIVLYIQSFICSTLALFGNRDSGSPQALVKVAGTVLNMQIIHCLWSPQLCAYTHACVHSLRLAGLYTREYNYILYICK